MRNKPKSNLDMKKEKGKIYSEEQKTVEFLSSSFFLIIMKYLFR